MEDAVVVVVAVVVVWRVEPRPVGDTQDSVRLATDNNTNTKNCILKKIKDKKKERKSLGFCFYEFSHTDLGTDTLSSSRLFNVSIFFRDRLIGRNDIRRGLLDAVYKVDESKCCFCFVDVVYIIFFVLQLN